MFQRIPFPKLPVTGRAEKVTHALPSPGSPGTFTHRGSYSTLVKNIHLDRIAYIDVTVVSLHSYVLQGKLHHSSLSFSVLTCV